MSIKNTIKQLLESLNWARGRGEIYHIHFGDLPPSTGKYVFTRVVHYGGRRAGGKLENRTMRLTLTSNKVTVRAYETTRTSGLMTVPKGKGVL